MSQAVAVTNPEKVLFPNDGIMKGDVVEYYRRITPFLLPHLRERPLALERFPNGIGSLGFFQKRASPNIPDWIDTVSLAKQNGRVRYVVCNSAEALTYLANQAVITPHPWLSRSDQPDTPDQLIFDLDPGGDDFRIVCHAAQELHRLLRERGLNALVKTTGSRGLHVMVALKRQAGFDKVRAFARQVAGDLARQDPEHLTVEVRKAARRGRLFIDIARNAYGQTAAPAYAVRARDGAPVATPLEWDELDDPGLRPDQFNIRNIFDRLKHDGDPWKDWNRHAQSLPG